MSDSLSVWDFSAHNKVNLVMIMLYFHNISYHTCIHKAPRGKNLYFPASCTKFPSSRVDFPPVWEGFPYVFLYFPLQITKFPCKELPVLPVFFFPPGLLLIDEIWNPWILFPGFASCHNLTPNSHFSTRKSVGLYSAQYSICNSYLKSLLFFIVSKPYFRNFKLSCSIQYKKQPVLARRITHANKLYILLP